MKWKKRQREIKRLQAAHAGAPWRNPFPILTYGPPRVGGFAKITDRKEKPKWARTSKCKS